MPTRSTTQRGYGSRHQALRRALLPRAIGTPCVRCGEPMLADQPLDLDHTDDRTGYRGFAHAECNRRSAGYKSTGSAPSNPRPKAATRW
jgi:hypothetical protein